MFLVGTQKRIMLCKVTYLQVLGIRMWIFWGTIILHTTLTHLEVLLIVE